MPADISIKVSAPGSIMLTGEHAVLTGELALACAVDARIHLTLTPQASDQISIDSALGCYTASRHQLVADERFGFILAAIRQVAAQLPSGFHLSVTSEFSHTLGLGSSAAITAAMVVALNRWLNTGADLNALFEQGLQVVHQVQQGRGSGTDLAASLYGGIIAYRLQPRQIEVLPGELPLQLYYCGYKMKTPAVLAQVEQQWQGQTALQAQLYQIMGQVSEAAAQALREQNLPELGRLFNVYQGLMDALGVNDATLSEIIYRLRAQPGVLGAKISGSGLGDCVLALGACEAEALNPYAPLTIQIARRGTYVEEQSCA